MGKLLSDREKGLTMAPYTRQKSEKTIRRAIDLWETYGKKYRTNLERYEKLLEKKRELKIYPLRAIKKPILHAYPKVTLLMFEEEDQALEYLEGLRMSQVKAIVEYVEYVVEYDYSYNTVCSRIQDYEYEIRHRNDRRSQLAADPDSIHRKHRGPSGVKEDS